ncbi:hypothetical protein NADFUDRAFT_82339 [Nadsonia fulvescens var. elongata DSM 6958]|uniref:RGS domain-containing protein n=1 Tax=Nadsonia fulvescens var. elongata DSM 6958 TaxID=857566 RepID=A0A1E3PNN7_9ASCO|nr:hypothetical protein NADFUDRAFT_82339 [Nadsonia fulvescens var. elongata DSM 6958]
MKSQYRGLDYLDFWLDVVQHSSLCRHFEAAHDKNRTKAESRLKHAESKERLRAGQTIRHVRNRNSKSSSDMLFDALLKQPGDNDDTAFEQKSLTGQVNGSAYNLDEIDSQRLSEILHDDDLDSNKRRSIMSILLARNKIAESDSHADYQRSEALAAQRSEQQNSEQQNRYSEKTDTLFSLAPSSTYSAARAPFVDQYNSHSSSGGEGIFNAILPPPQMHSSINSDHLNSNDSTSTDFMSKLLFQANRQQQSSTSDDVNSASAQFITKLLPGTSSGLPTPLPSMPISSEMASFVSAEQVLESTQRIFVAYFMPNAERELLLPFECVEKIRNSFESLGNNENRDSNAFNLDPSTIFLEPRDMVYQILENDYFPSFLQLRAIGNIIYNGSLIRLILGLIFLFVGFWVGFILIFLDYSRATRCWVILPFFLGSYCLISSLFNLDPLLALIGYSERGRSFDGHRWLIMIRDKYVSRLLVKRALFVFMIVLIIALILILIFVLVPGKRL